jgi:hypothetical protein
MIVLDHWHFPGAITKPVRDHYLQKEPIGENARMTVLLNIASAIAGDRGYGLPGEADYWQNTPARQRAVGVTDYQLRECGKEAEEAFASVKAAL